MTALDLALGLGVIGCAAHMVHALLGEPAGEITGDVAPSIVAEQTRPVGVSSTVEPLCLESHLQGALQPRFEPHRDGLVKAQGLSPPHRVRTFDQLIEAIGEICDLFTPDECWNFFEAAGYAP